ncbi:MAG: hypothetical protein QQW96_23595 [Tychonema bourrellyi B0820]|nr:hypothetical protein [Tychonema bourrellyi B0820]
MPQKNKFWFRDKPLLISSPAIRAWGIGHGAWGIGHGASGMGHRAWGTP